MDTQQLIAICETAIRERRELEFDYEKVDGEHRWGRVLAPFDIGSRNPEYRERNKDKLFAFSASHVNEKTGVSQPMVVTISIPLIARATILDSTFDPETLRQISKKNHPKGYDWGAVPDGYNIARNRGWFN